MGKVRWHTMMSLDGFIAGPGDDMQWMVGVDGGTRETVGEVLRARRAACGAADARRGGPRARGLLWWLVPGPVLRITT